VIEAASAASRYVALDGPDGCGKSVQAAALCEWLCASGRDALHVREPGSTPVGEALRALLLARATGDLLPLTEALLFTAARAELVAAVIAPALRQGRIVIAERCYLSTVVYQALASAPGLDLEWLLDLTRRAHGEYLPDAIFVLDVPEAVAAARRSARSDDRIEARDQGYHARVRRGYRRAAELEVRARIVDAAWPFASVQASLRTLVQELLP
jgi:dTMP kinase